MPKLDPNNSIPGLIGASFLILTTSLWTFWGIAELYYEGWGLPFPEPLAYLIPATACLLFSLLTLRWPRLGGWLLVAGGSLFSIWWWSITASRTGGLALGGILSMIPASTLLVISGGLFIIDGNLQRRRRELGWKPDGVWYRRNLKNLLAVGIPAAIILIVSAFQLPVVLGRYDDGGRGERLIRGNDVSLVWAPQGPGWNWRQEWGGYPSWASLALYGQAPIGLDETLDRVARLTDMRMTGLCAHLSADGLSLTAAPQYIWHMPTTDELLRSLSRDGENAGCRWDGGEGKMDCKTTPDKETPLWDPDAPPIYYWSADEMDQQEAYYVSYNGYVNAQPKTFGNPRHGYRCVRSP